MFIKIKKLPFCEELVDLKIRGVKNRNGWPIRSDRDPDRIG